MLILAKRYIKIWIMLWLLKHLETNKDIFLFAEPVLRQEIARSSGLTVIKEFVICCQDSCAHMLFARTHNGMHYQIWKWIVLYYLPSHCSVISSNHLRKDSGVKSCCAQKLESDKTETFHWLNSLIWKRRLIRSFLDYLYELYRLEISCQCVQHTQIGWYYPKERHSSLKNSPVCIFIPEHHNEKEYLLGLLQEHDVGLIKWLALLH